MARSWANRGFPPQAQKKGEPLLWVTMDEPKVGQIINVDGVRCQILSGTWTGTVAKLRIEPVEDDE